MTQIRIGTGWLEGTQSEGVSAFLGVPYAAPPLGDLRWRAPRPAAPWDGVRDAKAFSPQCVQPGRPGDSVYAEFAGVQPMSEDCLYLNVWTSAPQPAAKLPVMVWIHGGAFLQGAGSNPVFVRGDLPRKGVVLVTFNYRLGPFGFMAQPQLTQEGEGASGNYGLLDMAAALRWVKRNIAAFGGDPDRVTIFGQSAGGAGVIDLMASPQTRGLFQRAIAQSFGVGQMNSLAEAEASGERFARSTGAANLSQLRAMDAHALLDAYLAWPDRWMPIVDGRFIAEPVRETFVRGGEQAVPLLTGWNADEGTTFPAAANEAEFRAELQRRFHGDLHAQELYPAPDDATARRSSREMLGDELFALGVWRAARGHAKVAATFVYHFDHVQPFAAGQRYREADPASTLGAFHSSEYPYVFGTTGELTREWGDNDRCMTQMMQARWLAFARTGRPDAQDLPQWPPFVDGEQTVMRLALPSEPIALPRRAQLEYLDR